ncbi:hypothetical protein WM40_12840 [Robbsia andropogonis]|uniref:Uncharacterized protein n=1 Tax=Robbsia andropogonis TaxID=28092 RepID=A0A0F5JZ41_9BURK|nr:hypothetical protein WM40_12840 [Robbsia andropogonis]
MVRRRATKTATPVMIACYAMRTRHPRPSEMHLENNANRCIFATDTAKNPIPGSFNRECDGTCTPRRHDVGWIETY